MTDPKHEPVSYRWPEGEYGAWVFANRAPVWPDLPEGGEVEPLYPASTVEALTAQLDALKEENERLKAQTLAPQAGERVIAGVTVNILLDQCERLAQPIRASTKSFQYASALDNCVAVIKALWSPEATPQSKQCPSCGGTGSMGPFFPGGLSTVCGNCQPQPQLPESGESVEGGELTEINAALKTIDSTCLMLQYDHTGRYGVETIEPLRNVAKLINKLVWQQATKERP